ncbi:MAG TPA: aspartate kinase [Bacillota bacterium]
MKVVKFGGSSVASGEQFKKVVNILGADPKRKIVIVSAPGKRHSNDTKTTDLLINLAESVSGKTYDEEALTKVVNRYAEIVDDLSLPQSWSDSIKDELQQTIAQLSDQQDRLLDALKASGEDNNAKLLAAYLQSCGYEATYVSPKEAGIIVTDEPGNAKILPESYEKLALLKKRNGILVIPGFFGYSNEGNIVTFPRGGSDITGSIVAAGVQAKEYENFTDVDCIYSVNPTIVNNPHAVKELTYQEMRELSYAGFSVFHDEALQPAFERGVPVRVKNTNNPDAPGTRIVAKRRLDGQSVVGIASDEGFCSLNVAKYLMNREIGFGRKLLRILEEENISYEHTPSGIDNMSVIIRCEQLENGKEERILERIRTELHVDRVDIERDLAMIMIVGEGMNDMVGIAAKAATALADVGVNIKMINQGSSEVSVMFGIKADDVTKAVQSLYKMFF